MSVNLPPTAYIKMIDCWLIFSLLKPFVDIILQTYIQTVRERTEERVSVQAWAKEKEDMRIRLSRILLRVIYPTFFTVFVVIFWMVGMIHYSRL